MVPFDRRWTPYAWLTTMYEVPEIPAVFCVVKLYFALHFYTQVDRAPCAATGGQFEAILTSCSEWRRAGSWDVVAGTREVKENGTLNVLFPP